MEQMRVISTKTHGVIDYVAGILLLLAPNLFGFADEGGAQVLIPRILGLMMLAMALITDYELSVANLIPFPIHLMVDAMSGLLLLISPFLFGFADNPANEWLPHVVVGLGELMVVAMSRTHREEAATMSNFRR